MALGGSLPQINLGVQGVTQGALSKPSRRKKEKFLQSTEFERGRIIGLREGRFSYHAIGARVQQNRSQVMRVGKQWTEEHRTTRKTGSR
ncbi:uncharacterized protein TNCV_1867921 [Trichonephila clavipes]|nr:uncharacterized protein TNCV_1867921 [Trichonephila clavipes]